MQKVYHKIGVSSILKKLQFFSVFVFCLLSFVWLSKVLLLGYYPDFNTQYYVPKVVFAGQNPYLGGSKLYTAQVYPPTEFILFIPISMLPIKIVSYIYTASSIAALIFSLILLTKIFNIPIFSRLNLFLMGLTFISFPVKFTLGMGQINLFILSSIVYSIWLLKNKREFASGIVLGILLVVKLFPALLPAYFLMKFQRKILLGIMTSLLVSILLVVIFIPFHIYSSFFTIFPSLISSWKLDYYNQSLGGFVGRSFGTGETAIIIKSLVSIIIILLTFFATLKNKNKDFLTTALKIGTLITASLLVNTFSWQHHFVWLIIPFYATVFYLIKNKLSKKYFALLFVSYFLGSVNFKNPTVLPMLLQSHVFYGAIVLFFLDVYLLVKKSLKIVG